MEEKITIELNMINDPEIRNTVEYAIENRAMLERIVKHGSCKMIRMAALAVLSHLPTSRGDPYRALLKMGKCLGKKNVTIEEKEKMCLEIFKKESAESMEKILSIYGGI